MTSLRQHCDGSRGEQYDIITHHLYRNNVDMIRGYGNEEEWKLNITENTIKMKFGLMAFNCAEYIFMKSEMRIFDSY